MHRLCFLFVLFVGTNACLAQSTLQSPLQPPPVKPVTRSSADKPGLEKTPSYVDDEKLFDGFVEKLKILAKAGKCISPEKLEDAITSQPRLKTPLTLAAPKTKAIDPEDVYDAILPSVVIIGSVKPSEDDPNEYEDGGFGTAWCVAAEGIFVTNAHMFANSKNERFGIGTRKGSVYPVVEILALDNLADVAVFRVEGKGFTPLSVSEKPARVGSWIATLGHPGNHLFTFTQGHVTRYSKEKTDAGVERWMSITAEYAQGSSGGPVVDRFGNVVGMAALTVNIDAIDEPIPAEKPEKTEKPDKTEKPEKPKAKPDLIFPPSSTIQMVVKQAVPLGGIRQMLGAK
ncbi:MAG: serine protease [Gemmataceae bacterium]